MCVCVCVVNNEKNKKYRGPKKGRTLDAGGGLVVSQPESRASRLVACGREGPTMGIALLSICAIGSVYEES